MYTVVKVKDTTQKGKVVQADKTLFQRFLVAADAGRDSIKAGTRAKLAGQRRSIHQKIDSRDVPLPANWNIDLAENKVNLAEFLSHPILKKKILCKLES